MPLSQDLIDAYHAADYVVFTDPQLVLKIGEPSPRLDALLEQAGAAGAAFVSAANPRGERRSDGENATAASALDDLVAAAGYPRHPGEGRDPQGRWRAEPSLLVLGIYRDNAEALGRLFGQNAIVFVEKGRPAELLLLA